jgi:3-phenylpropionate/trans-cinnamate dioxygenase ferredoxin component
MTGPHGSAVRVCALSELDNRKPAAFEVDGVPVVLVRDGERVHALHDVCSHAEVALSEGEVTRRGIECWLHGSCFDLATGRPLSPPATEPVDVFPTDIRYGDVFIDVSTQ